VDSTLYHQLIGSLMYLVNTKLDVCFAVKTLSQFMVEPRRVHWVAAKHVLRYLCGTVDYGLDYHRGDGVHLVGYTDSDWVGCVSDRKNHFKVLLWIGISSCVLVQSEAEFSGFEFGRG
jgi:hypothetical protein